MAKSAERTAARIGATEAQPSAGPGDPLGQNDDLGGLVFSGADQGLLAAFDSRSGQRLWEHRCEAGVNAPPITYAIDGRQYVAVAAGGNALLGFKQGDSVVVFGLP